MFKRCKQNDKQRRPWSDCSMRSSLIWVCTVCSDLSVPIFKIITVSCSKWLAGPRSAVSSASDSRYPVRPHTFVSPSADSRRAVVSYWRKYVHEVLVNRFRGLSLLRKSVVRITDRPDMTSAVYRGCKTTTQQQQLSGWLSLKSENEKKCIWIEIIILKLLSEEVKLYYKADLWL